MPVVGIAVAAGILGITGAPFFNGSISKYLLAQGGSLADYAFLIINFGTALSFVKFGKMLFGKGSPEKTAISARSTGVVLLLGLMCLLTGVLAAPMLQLIFEMDLKIGVLGYLKKALIWAVSIFAAGLIYTKIISRSKRLKAGIDFSANFNQMILCTGASFAVLLAVAHIFTIA